MSRFLALLLLILAVAAPLPAAWHEHELNGSLLPEENTPPWRRFETTVKSGARIESEPGPDGLLIRTIGLEATRYWGISWDGSTQVWRPHSESGTTVEIEVGQIRAASERTPFAGAIFLSGFPAQGEFYSTGLLLGEKGVTFNGRHIAVDNATFHRYRLTYAPAEQQFTLYIDDAPEPAARAGVGDIKPEGGKAGRLLLGSTFAPLFQGEMTVRTLRWTNAGAFPPDGTPPAPMRQLTRQSAAPVTAPPAPADDVLERARAIVDAWERFPQLGVPPVPRPPDPALWLDDPVWQQAAALSGLISYQSGQVYNQQDQFFFCYDAAALYVGFRIRHPDPSSLRGLDSGRLESIWGKDDGLEFTLSCDPQRDVEFVLMGNSSGGYSEGQTRDRSFDDSPRFGWRYASRRTDTGYEGVLIIPPEAFRAALAAEKTEPLPLQPGVEWGLNVMRYDLTPEKRQADFTRMWGDFYDGRRLVRLHLLPEATALRELRTGQLQADALGAELLAVNRSGHPWELQVDYEFLAGNGDLVAKRFNVMHTWDLILRFRQEGPAIQGIALADQISESGHLGKLGAAYLPCGGRQSRRVTVPAGASLPLNLTLDRAAGFYLLLATVRAADTGNILLARTLPLQVDPEMLVTLRKRFLTLNGIEVETRFKTAAPAPRRLDYRISSERGELLSLPDQAERNPHTRFIDLSPLPTGAYTLTVNSGSLSRRLDFRKPEVPTWYGHKLGESDQVLPPWTALEYSGHSIAVWGRRYEWHPQAPLPVQITSQQRELLAAPVSLHLAVQGRPVTLSGSQQRTLERPDRMQSIGTFAAGEATVKLQTTLEFDGLLTFDLNVTSPQPLTELRLQIPFRREAVTFWGGAYWGTRLNEATPDMRGGRIEAFKQVFPSGRTRFAGLFQLGDDEGFLQFICGSDRDWNNADRQAVLGVRSEGDAWLLDIAFIDQPTDCAGGRTFRWSLMPTPVKDNRSGINLEVATINGMASGNPKEPFDEAKLSAYAEKLKQYNVNYVMYGGYGPPFHADVWMRGANRTHARPVMETLHRHGLKVFLYALWGYDVNGDEYEDFGDEMMKRPIQPCYPDTYWYSPVGPFPDFWMAGLQKTVAEFGFDGAYFDGFAVCRPLFDPPMNLGYVDADGVEYGEWPFLALRHWAKRVYAYMHERDGIVYQHVSGTIPNMAILSFADFICGGEEAPNQDRLLTCWPLDDYLLKYYQRPYGVTVHTLWYDWWKRPIKENQALAVTLLFGQLLNFYGGQVEPYRQKAAYGLTPAPAMKLLRALRAIRPADCQWFPFWKSGKLLALPEPLLGSLWVHPGRETLMVIANLQPQAHTGTITLNGKALGLEQGCQLTDVILEETVPIQPDGSFTLTVDGERYRMLKATAIPAAAP